jgi:DNA-binding transcriptional MerR regulator
MNANINLFSVSDLAKEFGVTTRTIRFYEDKDLLSPQRVGDRRVYNYADKARLSMILRFKKLDFPLIQIKDFLDLYDVDETRVVQLKKGFRLISSRIEGLELKIADLQVMHEDLLDLKKEAVDMLLKRGVDPAIEL